MFKPISIITLLVAIFLLSAQPVKAATTDTTVTAAMRETLGAANNSGLHFPASVKRFYNSNGFQPVWTNQADQKLTTDAMLLLDCVLQYGLSHNDFHPRELTYDKLKEIFEHRQTVDSRLVCQIDLMLTDAMITMINYLHWGKLNPYYGTAKLDEGTGDIDVVSVLQQAIVSHHIEQILNVQPKLKEYAAMQEYMRLWKGQYAGDCYEEPAGAIEKVTINMERLRWSAFGDGPYLWVNIPSYTLNYFDGNATRQFRVIVGKQETPTPTLNSRVTYFTTAPEWRVPRKIFVRELLPKAIAGKSYLENNHYAIYDNRGNYVEPLATNLEEIRKNPGRYYVTQSAGCDNSLGLVVFRFNNPFDIYLHDTPQQQLFGYDQRAFSHGCIRVQEAQTLAELLLKNDGMATKVTAMKNAVANYQTKDFKLKTPVPIRITYITGTIKDGQFIAFPDVYNLDKSLALALFMANKSESGQLAEH